ncbi:hypothetical protein [Thalassoroseus pseudoceratinae]|uniref:hypothetical protein n=1 Tax=Thalassoroseus pseudoceratinae TaxID=2713176 RepID=UPI00141E85B6|nr:hypothetical protein [Thalassoroseus pseudoceratinae]
MRFPHTTFALLLTLTASLTFIGCTNQEEKPDTQEIPDNPPPAPSGSKDAHPTRGPHHGRLIELGKEEYHGELLHDEDTDAVTIYLLDGSAKNTVPIDAEEVTVNVSRGGKPKQFELKAQPVKDDPDGQSSRFFSDDKELGEHLDEDGANARLVVKIGGKSYNGEISHEDHGHQH